MKKIFLFEKLNIFTLIISFFLKIFLKKVYYRELSLIFKNDFYINIFKKMDILWLGFQSFDNKYSNQSFNIRRKLELNLVNNYIEKNFFFNCFVKKHNPNIEKFKLCLIGEFAGNYSESLSISLIEKCFSLEKSIIYYFPFQISSYLLIKNYHKNLKVFSICIIVITVLDIFKKVFNKLNILLFKRMFNWRKKKTVISDSKYNYQDFEVAYFPHKSLRYGKSYNKTLIFSDVPTSKFFKSKVLNILKEPMDSFSLKYFKFYKIPHVNIGGLYSDFKVKKMQYLLESFKILKFFKKFSLHEFFLSYYIVKIIYSIEKNLNLFERLKKLRIIYCDYDVLFPKTILLACDIKNIKTISNQERYLLNYLLPPLFYNYYLTVGKQFEEDFKKKGYIVDEYFSIGTLRTSKDVSLKKIKLNKEILRLKNKNKKIVLCLGINVADKYHTQLEGKNGNSVENNINFFEQIILLAKNFKDLYFIIRFKMDSNINLLPQNLLEEIEKMENLELNKVTSKVNIYELVHISNFVIGRYTSLIEESLLDGINTIIYDEINFTNSLEQYHFFKTVVKAKDRDDLHNYLRIFLDGKDLYGKEIEKEIKNSFSNIFINNNSKFKMQKILNKLI